MSAPASQRQQLLFGYITIGPNKLPLIRIGLESRTNRVISLGLVDTGSTDTFIPAEINDILSLDPVGRVHDATGAGGSFPVRPMRLPRLVLLRSSSSLFSSFTNITILVPTEKGRIPTVVLGRGHVFNRFNISFLESQSKMVFDGPCEDLPWP